jgi:hypothetical protein
VLSWVRMGSLPLELQRPPSSSVDTDYERNRTVQLLLGGYELFEIDQSFLFPDIVGDTKRYFSDSPPALEMSTSLY